MEEKERAKKMNADGPVKMFKQGDWSHTDGQFMVNTQKFNYEAVEEAETARSLLSRTWLEMLV